MGTRTALKFLLSVIAICVMGAKSTLAVEGGSGHYLLGSRDLGAGFMPPPGFYQTNDFVALKGEVDRLAIGGVAVTDAELELLLYKIGGTYVSDFDANGGRLGVTVQLPIAAVDMDFAGVIFQGALSGGLSDRQSGLGDIVLSPMIGWDSGNFHYNFAGTMFLPTGNYDTASINLSERSIDVLSIGKNYFSFDPTAGITYLDPKTGIEVSGALGVTISTKNTATDYQTAPEMHFEGTVAQHFSSGLTIGLTGYAYYQLSDDSGTGAENFKKRTQSESLQARTFGGGAVVAWKAKLGDVGVTMKAKYIQEFASKRRFESRALFGNISFSF